MTDLLTHADFVSTVKFDDKGLVQVLMFAWMNRQTLDMTLATGRVTYWSRSRQSVWTKGETSGHHQHLIEAYVDCDGDVLLLKVDQMGPACHTGAPSCFFRKRAEA